MRLGSVGVDPPEDGKLPFLEGHDNNGFVGIVKGVERHFPGDAFYFDAFEGGADFFRLDAAGLCHGRGQEENGVVAQGGQRFGAVAKRLMTLPW
jgi:hypothetical protein